MSYLRLQNLHLNLSTALVITKYGSEKNVVFRLVSPFDLWPNDWMNVDLSNIKYYEIIMKLLENTMLSTFLNPSWAAFWDTEWKIRSLHIRQVFRVDQSSCNDCTLSMNFDSLLEWYLYFQSCVSPKIPTYFTELFNR